MKHAPVARTTTMTITRVPLILLNFFLLLMLVKVNVSGCHCVKDAADNPVKPMQEMSYRHHFNNGQWSWHGASCNRSAALLLSTFRYFMEKDETFDFDPEEEELNRMRRLGSVIQHVTPPFVFTAPYVKNTHCLESSRKFVNALQNLKMWALKMHDSTAKTPSGLLNGNVNQFGDFDMCLNALREEDMQGFQGKYCLASLQLHRKTTSATHAEIYNLMLSHAIFRSQLTDSGHRVPRFSTINWALCVPSSCSSTDVQNQLESLAERYSNGTGFTLEVKVEPSMCQIKAAPAFSTSFWIATGILSLVIGIAVLATIWDTYFTCSSNLVRCFSLKVNFGAVMDTKRNENDLAAVHGARMINAIMLLLAHKSMALFFSPFSNRTYMTYLLGKDWSVLARAAALYTDPFIMISGLLTAHSYFQRYNKNQKVNVMQEYINRLFRIVPSMATIILVCTFILPEISSGPQWNTTVNHHAIQCKKYWWRNFLFIHNYFGFDEMCLTHTHHIGIDTQLFFLSPLLVWLVHRYRAQGISCLIALAALSTGLRYFTTLKLNLSYFVYPGITNEQMFRTADNSYTIPIHRLSMYVMGIILAYMLHSNSRDKMKAQLTVRQRRVGWTVAGCLFYLAFILPRSMGVQGYVYNANSAALYAALAPITWSSIFAWIIFIDYYGHGGIVSRIFSARIGIIWTKLSYSIYLTQFPIFFYNIGVQRSSIEYHFWTQLNLWEFISIFIASLALTLLVEYPFANIRKLCSKLK